METKRNKSGLKPKQIRALEMMINTDDIKTKKQICEELKISRSTFYRWFDNDEFLAAYKKMVSKYADRELSDVWQALIFRCKCGNPQALRLYYELRGDLKSNVTNNSANIVQIIDNISGDNDG